MSNLNNSVPFGVAFHSAEYLNWVNTLRICIWLSDKKKTRCQFNGDTYDGEFGDQSVQRVRAECALLSTIIDTSLYTGV